MSDPTELAGVGVGGLTVGGLLVGLLKAAGSRNIASLDDTLKSLKASSDSLAKEVQNLRETHIALAKDVGALTLQQQQQHAEIARLRRHIHKWGTFLQRITLKTATGEHVKVEFPEDGDDE